MTACCRAPLWRNRCTSCGHRQPVGGVAPIATRYFPPPIWAAELIGRWRARRHLTP